MESKTKAEELTAPKKLAVFNDFAGYGRCALTAAIPVISALKVQCCPVVTAVLSSHAAYPHYFFDDYTDRMEDYLSQWRRLGFQMDGILTGFFASPRQTEIAADFIRHEKKQGALVIVDPTMGDQGRLYRICSGEMREAMKHLLAESDLVTPNLTEACLLTQTPYRESGWTKPQLTELTERLFALGTKAVVLTGIVKGSRIWNVVQRQGSGPLFLSSRFEGGAHHGTGDVFAAVLAASLVRGTPLEESVRRAAAFTGRCVRHSEEVQNPALEGLCLEDCLSDLTKF